MNESFAANADLSRISGPAAGNLVRKLRRFSRGIDTGRITLRVSNAFRKSIKEKGQLRFAALEGMEVQRDHSLHQLLLGHYAIVQENCFLHIRVALGNKPVKKQNRLATHFYFEAILVSGNPAKASSLRTETIESPLYRFGEEPDEACELCLNLPEDGVSWMVLLKVGCLEGNEMAHHPMHYGMKVIAVDGV